MIHVFIVNSIVVENDFGFRLREYLKSRDDIKSFVFSTSYAGMEQVIAQRMVRFFDGERIRFYACGGSGTMRNVINGAVGYVNAEFAFP